MGEPVVLPATRLTPRIGDTVEILWGKHMGRVGKVSGRITMPTGSTWTVVRPDGAVMGDYAAGDVKILMGDSNEHSGH